MAATKDLNIAFTSATAGFNHRKDESDLQRQQQQQQVSSSLLRFRSAPSSLLAEACEDFLPGRPSSPGTESMYARFLAPDLRDKPSAGGSGGAEQRSSPFVSPAGEQFGGFSSASCNMLYQPQEQPMAEGANLIRQSSSPAGFFVGSGDNGWYPKWNDRRSWNGRGRAAQGQINFSSRQSTLSQISELATDGFSGEDCSPEESSNGHCLIPGYPVGSWEDSLLSGGFSSVDGSCRGGGFKRARDVVGINETEKAELGNHHGVGLAHQLSLPKTTSEMAAIEKFLQFQDSVPCKIRAKRGCATHPRSIAERVRRTRISERMRKLQELVPNMDKQTNTADMLDLAVDYIKDLQRQVKMYLTKIEMGGAEPTMAISVVQLLRFHRRSFGGQKLAT
ncbi:hypothetical protein HPP92_017826 [Vanilla planifolia]|uniref:BHLH domain-containing protein n=1 Tax=Vanilla planifolia TaxID=51239 RepID=A0A835Q8S1_VANPL|nr:hypothetical protein HPP92_017826 [Vanilla planifolia]